MDLKALLIVLSLLSINISKCSDQLMLHYLTAATAFPDTYLQQLAPLTDTKETRSSFTPTSHSVSLFTAYPSLRTQLAYIPFGNFPTPLTHCSALSAQLNHALYIKHDDLTGKKINDTTHLFGGNKVRKLEWVLADAQAQGCSTVISLGNAGSNNALATSIYARECGLKSICMLLPQYNSCVVQRNLLLQKYYDADLRACPTRELFHLTIAAEFLYEKQKFGQFPYIIPAGTSCPLGCIGYVNAAFELKEQIDRKLISEPDYIYVATGSTGTFAGLALGLKAAQIKSTLIGVAIEPTDYQQLKQKIVSLFHKTNNLLYTADTTFPLYDYSEDEITLLTAYTGPDYGVASPETEQAINCAATEHICLDDTYTGKAFAGLLDHVKTLPAQRTILFWNTFFSDPCTELCQTISYKELPHAFYSYFREP